MASLDDVSSFSNEANVSKIAAGIKGSGPFFAEPIPTPKLEFANGYPNDRNNAGMGEVKTLPILNTWVTRRPNGNVK